jgi:hypothetical protein
VKNILLLLGLLLFFNSCGNKHNPQEVLLAKQLCGQMLVKNDYLVSTIERSGNRSGSTARDRKILEDSRKMVAWRNNYLKAKNKANLLKYADALFQRLIALKVTNPKYSGLTTYGHDYNGDVVEEFKILKAEYVNSNDTLTHLQLFYRTLNVESYFHIDNAAKIGSDGIVCGKIFLYGIFNSRKVKLGDSVYYLLRMPGDLKINYVTVRLRRYNIKPGEELWDIWKKPEGKGDISLKVNKVWPYYLCHTIPLQKFKYIIKAEAEAHG